MIWEKGPLEIIEMGSSPGSPCFAELALTSDGGWPFHSLIDLKSKVLRRILGKVSIPAELLTRPLTQSQTSQAKCSCECHFPHTRHNRSHGEDIWDEVYPLAADKCLQPSDRCRRHSSSLGL